MTRDESVSRDRASVRARRPPAARRSARRAADSSPRRSPTRRARTDLKVTLLERNECEVVAAAENVDLSAEPQRVVEEELPSSGNASWSDLHTLDGLTAVGDAFRVSDPHACHSARSTRCSRSAATPPTRPAPHGEEWLVSARRAAGGRREGKSFAPVTPTGPGGVRPVVGTRPSPLHFTPGVATGGDEGSLRRRARMGSACPAHSTLPCGSTKLHTRALVRAPQGDVVSR